MTPILLVANTAIITVCIVIVSAMGVAAGDGPGPNRPAEAAGFLVGADTATLAHLNRCARVLPDRAQSFNELRDEVYRANHNLTRLAKEKWLAALEIQMGKAKRLEAEEQLDKTIFKELQEQTRNQTQVELQEFCNALLKTNPAKFFLAREYPREVELMIDYRVGYPWSAPNCEYRVTFPHEPKTSTTTEGGISMPKAETREEFGLPYIGVICMGLPASHGDAVESLKRTGQQQMRDIGVRNLRWNQESSPIGERLTAVGEISRSGMAITIEKALWIGQRSLLEVTTTEETEDYPSIKTIQFREWAENK